jgi:hypothetical protein
MAGFPPKLTGAHHRAIGLGQRQCTNIAQQRIRGSPGVVRQPASFLNASQVRERVCLCIGDLELGLVGGDLVDDVAVGGGERLEGAIAALVYIRRVSLIDEAAPGGLRGNHQVLFSRADFGTERGYQPVAQIGALQQEREFLVDRAIEGPNGVHSQQGDDEHQRQQERHPSDHPTPEAAQHPQCPPARRTTPSRTIPI